MQKYKNSFYSQGLLRITLYVAVLYLASKYFIWSMYLFSHFNKFYYVVKKEYVFFKVSVLSRNFLKDWLIWSTDVYKHIAYKSYQ